MAQTTYYSGALGQEEYPNYISWHLSLEGVSDAFDCFSTKTRKKIRRGLRLLEEAGGAFTVMPIDDDAIDIFQAMHEGLLKRKQSNLHVRADETIMKGIREGKQIEMLSLWYQNKMIGAMVFHIKQDVVRTIYKVFPEKFDAISLPINLTFLAEYNLFQYAIKRGAKEIIHGRDRNLYGINSSIGLAMFKTQLGCEPRVSKVADIAMVGESIPLAGKDILCFLGATQGEVITKAILFTYLTEEEAMQKYQQLYNNKHYQLTVQRMS